MGKRLSVCGYSAALTQTPTSLPQIRDPHRAMGGVWSVDIFKCVGIGRSPSGRLTVE